MAYPVDEMLRKAMADNKRAEAETREAKRYELVFVDHEDSLRTRALVDSLDEAEAIMAARSIEGYVGELKERVTGETQNVWIEPEKAEAN